MITVTLPEWLVLALIGLWISDLAVKAVLIFVTRLNNQASRDLLRKLARMAGLSTPPTGSE